MSPKLPEDLLSAFHDRELTAAEEGAAKERVEKSPEAKQEINDYARLSQLLGELPRETAPAHFGAAVMRQAERETLIPLPEPAQAVPAKSRFARLAGRPLWIAAGVGAAAVAAGITVLVLPRRPSPSEPVIVLTQRSLARTSDRVEMAAKSAPRAGSVNLDDAVLGSKGGAAMPEFKAAGSSSALGLKPADGYLNSKSEPLGAPSIAFPANLKTAKVGDVIEALESDGQQVAVVRLTVVDQAAGLDGIENVFVRNTSRTVQNEEELRRLKKRFAYTQSTYSQNGNAAAAVRAGLNKPGDLMCVFIEGTRDELKQVLENVQRENHIQEAQLTNTISVSQLERFAKRPVSNRERQLNEPPSEQRVDLLELPIATVDRIVSQQQSPQGPLAAQTAANGFYAGQKVDAPRKSAADAAARSMEKRKEVTRDSHDEKSAATTGKRAAPMARPATRLLANDQKDKVARSGGRAKLPAYGSQRDYTAALFIIQDTGLTPAQQRPAAAAAPAPAQAAPAKAAPAKAAQ